MKSCTVVSIAAVCVAVTPSSSAFLAFSSSASHRRRHSELSPTQVQLVPLSRYNDEVSFLKQGEDMRCSIASDGTFQYDDVSYELCLVEVDDIPDLAKFVVDAFGADAITLSQDLSAAERVFMSPAADFLNGYSGFVAYAEVLAGTRQRLESRLQSMTIQAPVLGGLSPKEMIAKAETDSLILALARKSNEGGSMNVEVIASIELRLQVSTILLAGIEFGNKVPFYVTEKSLC